MGEDYIWRSYVAEIFVASCFGFGGVGCFIYGLQSITSLMARLDEDLVRAVQSETGIFVFGGLLLMTIGLVLYLITPSGLAVDPSKRQVLTWRGIYPRLKVQRFPLEGAEVVVETTSYVQKGHKRFVNRLILAMPGDDHMLRYDDDRPALRERGVQLAENLGLPFVDRN